MPFYGLCVLCLDNEAIQDIIPKMEKRFTTYGLTSQADFRAVKVRFEGLTSLFEVEYQGQSLGQIRLNLTGVHNVYNALASIAVGRELGIGFDVIKQALETLEGVQRRLEIKGRQAGVTVVDDYGHHPTEIKTTLQAVRAGWPDKRVVVVFQPHRYTRTKALFTEFTRAFYESDLLLVMPIYSAGEAVIETVNSQQLCEQIGNHGHKNVHYCPSHEQVLDRLSQTVEPGDLVITLGAGDVFKVGEALLKRL